MSPRRKSIDSSGSSGEESGDSRGYKKDKKDKKDKDKKDKDKSSKDKDKKDKDKDKKDKDKKDKDKSEKKDHKDKDKKDKDKDVKAHKDIAGSGFSANPQAPMYGYRDGGDQQFSSPPIVPPHFDASRSPGFSDAPPPFPGTPSAPHVQTGAPPPPSGYRLPLSTTEVFADPYQTGQPPFWDADGTSPIFIGSALFETSVHPCKIGPHLQPFVSVAWGGSEHGHHGRYDLLPFVPETMEWVVTSYGRIPPGRRPIEGGYEENGAKLYHGAAVINGIRIPGKAGEHLSGCNVAFGGSEVAMTDHEILCWR
ncbi:hypothetical protein BDZ94DRAFT_1247216 [Collybia nuda]|uniref:Uncharacterized protein n=1 Tax=Collybia nuda TaxID=64659 RepID=A0A9P6CPZ0_9AGAR|nr:hypothetical protein BDZ94DRAFT_1247216 [Collybia nuda]